MRSERARCTRCTRIAEIALSDPYDSRFPCVNDLWNTGSCSTCFHEIRVDDNSAPIILREEP
jgi:hypothetical protein